MAGQATLELLVPGLVGPWPAHQLPHVCEAFDASSLARILVRGDRAPVPPSDDSVAGAIMGVFGCPLPGPVAAATWLADRPTDVTRSDASGADIGTAWLRVDPVSLRVEPHGAMMLRGEALHLDLETSMLLAAELAGIGDQAAPRVTVPSRWYLPVAPDIVTRAPSSVWGPAAREALPEGRDGARWRAWLTEAQMVLHASPLNDQRESAGLAPINSVWLWGSGQLTTPPAGGFDRVVADDPVARGLAMADGLTPESLADLTALPVATGRTLLVIDQLHGLARGGNVEAWREGVAWFERTYAEAALEALAEGRIAMLRLVVPPFVDIRLTRRALRRFWRLRRPIAAALASLAQDSNTHDD